MVVVVLVLIRKNVREAMKGLEDLRFSHLGMDVDLQLQGVLQYSPLRSIDDHELPRIFIYLFYV